MFFKKLTIAAGLLAMFATAGSAATCTSGGGVTFTLTQGNPDAVVNEDCLSGNNNNTIDSSFNIFGQTGWTLASTSNDASGNQALTFGAPVPVSDQTAWSILNPLGYSSVFITLKQGNYFAAFLLDTSKALSGLWGTFGPGRAINDLSHASIYYRGTPSPVPLPAAGWLLVGGIGGLVAMRRKRKAL